MTTEERLARLEESIAQINARLDSLDSRRSTGQSAPQWRHHATSARRVNPLAAKSTEWWLARGGAVLTCFALILLYQYAIERNWITPIVRVVAGTLVGAGLFVAGMRTPRRTDTADIGLREVLLGAGLSAWYITAYAAAIFYTLIPITAARVVFLGLSVLGAWLALRETRSILALLALAVGFATPALLPSSEASIPAFALYLAALTAIGLILYLMRGWQLVLWLTFAGFWWLAGSASNILCCTRANSLIHLVGSVNVARVALATLIVLGAAAFMRVPMLRRLLLATGSPLYTAPRRSDNAMNFQRESATFVSNISGREAEDDSLAIWFFFLASPLLAILELSWTLSAAPPWQWGLIALIAAAAAWAAMRAPRDADSEVTHLLAAGVALWSLVGLAAATDAVSGLIGFNARFAAALTVHALIALELTRNSRYAFPRGLALGTALVLLIWVIAMELIQNLFGPALLDAPWLVAELGAVALALWIWWNRKEIGRTRYGKFMGAGSYVALMFIDARVLGSVWPPLVTASYAIAGAALLVYARAERGTATMRRLGSITLIIVVARLLLVDLARVETIWRVLLFLGCGGLFLLTSHRLQSAQPDAETEQPA